MSVVNRQFDCFDEIQAAEEAVDAAAAAVDAARGRLCEAAETFFQAQNNLVKAQQEHGIPVPEWPEHSMIGRRWWPAEVPEERPRRIT
jgi:hypothetical protein